MKTQSTALTLMATLLVFSVGLFGSANAARRVCEDGTYPPCNDSGSGMEPPDYGDLIILYRDPNGVPIPSPEVTVTDPETGLPVDGGLCWQPIAFNVGDLALCPAGCVVDSVPGGTDVVDVDQYNCAVVDGCSGCTQEVDFGRVNAARSPDTVFDSQLADVVVNLATADCVTLDPAGRLVASRVVNGEPLSGAIDSPLQNMAIYKQLMLTGTIGVPLPAGTLDTAARGVGAGLDKTGKGNVDLIAYLNQIMGLSDPNTSTILDPKLCETYREEVQGVIQLVEKCFLNYSTYGYDRATNFGALPDPAYIPAGAPVAGTFEYLAYVLASDPPLFEIVYGPILDAVFCVDGSGNPLDAVAGICPGTIDPGFTAGNIGGFAQAADDTRAVIDFMHNWPVPGAFPTPVPCAASGSIAYDVLISEESGLQVPRNIIDGSEGREFIVTVANASGSADPAAGTVTVTAVSAVGGDILADLDGDGVFTDRSPFVFSFTGLAVGASESFSALFTVDIGQRTTIDWTAVAAAPDDVNLGNNTVTAVSNVKVTGSGAGGGGQGGGH